MKKEALPWVVAAGATLLSGLMYFWITETEEGI